MAIASAQRSAALYADTARGTRVLAADPHALVTIVYDELRLAFSVASRAARAGDWPRFAEHQQQALALLASLSDGLDRQRGGALAASLDALYDGVSRIVRRTNLADAPQHLAEADAIIADIAEAWAAIG